MAEQQTEIATLTNQLASANIRIEELNNQVTHLNSDVDSLNTGLTAEREQKEAAQGQCRYQRTQHCILCHWNR